MPYDAISDPWPNPFVTDVTDDSPEAIALDAIRWRRLGIG
jgi:hypothetical protein